ncbi:hypothetical protein P1X14_01190 [Sphingomonas sp. AOB5]|uniref:hypothetical protein n=1 Tax=Sphingomonas sp. AOB5 TaxID=3034017 RepID=UPI0023F92C70|nr:hypothetical protein [Sphingomonas sp. AOB5]MDF7773847.1 hypothetical protein [Sphingomonas sp. AOB5]
MEITPPKQPFPLKRLLRESLSQVAHFLVWIACTGVATALLQGMTSGFEIFAEGWLPLAVLGSIAIPLVLAAPILILDWRNARREKSLASR